MNAYGPEQLSNAVAAICPDVRAHVGRAITQLDERCLWWELSSCILSSQVPYTLAVAATDAIDAEGLLFDEHYISEMLAPRLIAVLSNPLLVGDQSRFYRFPVARARQLATTRDVVTTEAGTLRALVQDFHDAAEARTWLVNNLPGIGPKQASMFLRNVGVSYELAILDRHVLNYMSALGIYSGQNLSIGGLAQYSKHEEVLRDHAADLDCPVGLLDWAIWIVMRVASQKIEPIPI